MNLIKYAGDKADFIQIVRMESKEKQMDIADNTFNNAIESHYTRYFVKAWTEKKMGSVSSCSLDKRVIDNAIRIAKASKEDSGFFGLPGSKAFTNVKGLYSEEIAGIGEERVINIVSDFLEKNKGLNIPEAGLSLGVNNISISNSEGADFLRKGTFFGFEAGATIRNDSSYSDSVFSRDIVSLDALARHVREKLYFYLERKNLSEKIDGVILMPRVLSELFDNAFLGNLNSFNLKRKNSLFDKTGERIISEEINLTDDATLDKGSNSYEFDCEGSAGRKNILIQKGVLKKFITDYNLARQFGFESTANAGMVMPSFSNVILDGRIIEDVFEFGKRFLVVDAVLGAHTSNQLTTDFSVNVMNGYLLERDRKIPLKELMVSGRFVDVLNDFKGFCFEREERQGFIARAMLFGNSAIKVIN